VLSSVSVEMSLSGLFISEYILYSITIYLAIYLTSILFEVEFMEFWFWSCQKREAQDRLRLKGVGTH
jgi:hypothetical protein